MQKYEFYRNTIGYLLVKFLRLIRGALALFGAGMIGYIWYKPNTIKETKKKEVTEN